MCCVSCGLVVRWLVVESWARLRALLSLQRPGPVPVPVGLAVSKMHALVCRTDDGISPVSIALGAVCGRRARNGLLWTREACSLGPGWERSPVLHPHAIVRSRTPPSPK
jgi:hypothetical protein